ncbi:ABC transporter permease [Mycoplasma sp. OR1901]|uniref:PhnE/PtxC family ABC transporter permease n=1 Tax=Mycoplasma sp. OR1901 TaxID=2742195 RepID=UPI001583ED6C|nr:ABC transporter permease [Mycoplasma sp. OR1901]QKT05546.1 ABC transporter permease [Mycoplasma sp. OR1901]
MTKKQFNNKIKQTKTIKWLISLVLVTIFIVFSYYSSFFEFYSNFELIWERISSLFKFNHNDIDNNINNLWLSNLRLLWVTIKTTLTGTLCGLILAFFTSYLNAINLHKKRFFAIAIKFLISILRSFPLLIIIYFFKKISTLNLTAFLIFFWSTWLWMHRYFNDIIENSDVKKYWTEINLGKNKFRSFYKNVVLNNKNRFIMNSILAYESNIRWSSILGSIGIYGIGLFIDAYKEKFEYLSISIFYIVTLLIILESLLVLFNKFIGIRNSNITRNINFNKTLRYNYKKIISVLFLIIIFVVFIFGLIDLFKDTISLDNFKKYFKELMSADFSYLKGTWKFYYFDYIKAFIYTYQAIFLAVVFSLLYSFLLVEKIISLKVTLLAKFIIILLKSIPAIIYFYFIIILFSEEATFIFMLSVIAFRALTKQISEKINSKVDKKVQTLISLGYSKWKIYKTYLIPQIKKDIYSFVFFEFEGTYRNAINYGIFTGVVSINTNISYFESKDKYEYIIPLMLPSISFFIMLEFCLLFIKYKKQIKEYIKNNYYKSKPIN